MKIYQVGPKVKGNIKETFNLHLGPSKQRKKEQRSTYLTQLDPKTHLAMLQAQPTTHLPNKGGGETNLTWCSHTRGAAAPLLPPRGPTFGRVVPSMISRTVWVVS
jgi:hypothetical protein